MHGGACGPVDMVVGVVPLSESAKALMDMTVCLALDDTNVMSHGGEVCEVGLVGNDYIGLKDNVNFMLHGGADDQMTPMDVLTDGDTKNQAANTMYGGDPSNRFEADFLGTLNFSLDFSIYELGTILLFICPLTIPLALQVCHGLLPPFCI